MTSGHCVFRGGLRGGFFVQVLYVFFRGDQLGGCIWGVGHGAVLSITYLQLNGGTWGGDGNVGPLLLVGLGSHFVRLSFGVTYNGGCTITFLSQDGNCHITHKGGRRVRTVLNNGVVMFTICFGMMVDITIICTYFGKFGLTNSFSIFHD